MNFLDQEAIKMTHKTKILKYNLNKKDLPYNSKSSRSNNSSGSSNWELEEA